MRILLAIPCFILSALPIAWLAWMAFLIPAEPGLQGAHLFDSDNRLLLINMAGAFIIGVVFGIAGIAILSFKRRRDERRP
jgi:hypothetical protein